MAEPRCVSGAYRAQLGESPLWDEQARCLWFVDIIAPSVGRIRVDEALSGAGEAPKLWRLPNWCAAYSR
jgi:sugar lactone lactonase YvrE